MSSPVIFRSCEINISSFRETFPQLAAIRSFYIKNCGKDVLEPDPVPDPCIPCQSSPDYHQQYLATGISYNRYCLNDENFCNRFIDGDIIYLQFNYDIRGVGTPSPLGWHTSYAAWGFDIIIEDIEGNVLMSGITNFADDYGIGWDDNFGNNKQWINIDTSYFTAFDTFVIHLIIATEGGNVDVYLPRYCRVECWEENVLITSDMANVDLDGNIFVDPDYISGDSINYLNQIRIPAEFIKNGFKIENTLINNVLTKSKKIPQYLLRVQKVPEYAADKIALVLSGANVMISYYKGDDRIIYPFQIDNPETISKNFDEGHDWIIELLLNKTVDEVSVNCTT